MDRSHMKGLINIVHRIQEPLTLWLDLRWVPILKVLSNNTTKHNSFTKVINMIVFKREIDEKFISKLIEL